MKAKTPLKVVATLPDPNAPPRALGEHGLSLWRAVMSEYDVQDMGGREMLAQACAALDRAESCAAHIRQDGEVIRSKTGLKENPLLKHEIAARSFVVRTLARLGLDVEAVRAVGRPPAGGFRG